MDYEVSFGRLDRAPPVSASAGRFRLAVLGDFSGRANAGLLETGEDLAKRKPIKVDVDNLDTVLARMTLNLSLTLGEDDAAVSVPINSLDDFHPDQLVENVELFESLLQLRRDLSSKAGFARAAKEVLSWTGEKPLPRARKPARGAKVATDKRLSDFARLTGRSAPSAEVETSVDDLMRRLVGPYIQPARDKQQPELLARVDQALSAAMRRVLHHPDFQTAEAMWRGVELLVRRIETSGRTQIILYDVSAEELAADLAATDALEETGLYGMMIEEPAKDADQGPLSAVIGLYGFELSPPHADLLGRVAQIAKAANAPFIAAISPDPLQTKFDDQNPLIRQAWTALWELPAAAWLGLVTPRFLLRMPYGKSSDPIDAFAFEEFTREAGLSGMLWGHPALIPGLLLAQAWLKGGAKMQPGSVAAVGDMPYYVYTAEDGDKIALPCTERLYSQRQAALTGVYHVMPIVTLRGRPEVRLASFASLAGERLMGFWGPASTKVEAPPPPTAAASEDSDSEASSSEDSDSSAESSDSEESSSDSSDDLSALLDGLSTPEEEPAEGSTDADLDALLASL